MVGRVWDYAVFPSSLGMHRDSTHVDRMEARCADWLYNIYKLATFTMRYERGLRMDKKFEMRQTVYYIQSHHDELPCIKEGLVIPFPQGMKEFEGRYVNTCNPQYPKSWIGYELLSLDDAYTDKSDAHAVLHGVINDRIVEFRADIDTLVKHRLEQAREWKALTT